MAEAIVKQQQQTAKSPLTNGILQGAMEFGDSLIKSKLAIQVQAETLNELVADLQKLNSEAAKLPFGYVKSGIKTAFKAVAEREMERIAEEFKRALKSENQ